MARIAFKGKTWSVIPIDLSLAGILVELSQPDVVDIAVDTVIGIELRVNDKRSVLTGLVRRINPNQYGILFVESLKNGELSPPGIPRWYLQDN